MIHYKSRRGLGRSLRPASHPASIGDVLESHYRARWRGVLLAADSDGIATVRMTHDRRGRPARKQKIFRYHISWFRVVAPQPLTTD